jgi:hypothetical protein
MVVLAMSCCCYCHRPVNDRGGGYLAKARGGGGSLLIAVLVKVVICGSPGCCAEPSAKVREGAPLQWAHARPSGIGACPPR